MFVLRELFDFWGLIRSPAVSPQMEIKDWDHFLVSIRENPPSLEGSSLISYGL